MAAELRLEKVNKSFGGVVVADEIDLTLHSEEILGLIGPNGAGKTSLFNIISGVIKPDSGSVYFEEREVNDLDVYQRARIGISRTWQHVRLFLSMTVMDNLLIGSRVYKGESLGEVLFRPYQVRKATEASRHRALRLLERVGLSHEWDKKVSGLPFGKQKLISLARALMNEGKCLLLDEPMAGVEGDIYETIKSVVREEAKSGKAVCVVEHSVSFIKDLCDSAIFMFDGKIIERGKVEDLLRSKRLSDIYFGAAQF